MFIYFISYQYYSFSTFVNYFINETTTNLKQQNYRNT